METKVPGPTTDQVLRQMAEKLAANPDPEMIHLALRIAFLTGEAGKVMP